MSVVRGTYIKYISMKLVISREHRNVVIILNNFDKKPLFKLHVYEEMEEEIFSNRFSVKFDKKNTKLEVVFLSAKS